MPDKLECKMTFDCPGKWLVVTTAEGGFYVKNLEASSVSVDLPLPLGLTSGAEIGNAAGFTDFLEEEI